MSSLPVLTINQPYAYALSLGVNTVAQKSRNYYRGNILIYSAKKKNKTNWDLACKELERLGVICPTPEILDYGVIVAIAKKTDCYWSEDQNTYLWVFDEVKPFKNPVPCSGRSGIFFADLELDEIQGLIEGKISIDLTGKKTIIRQMSIFDFLS